ncbi:MAG: 3-oxoacyl-[acyl-carrier-protein] reductase [Holosporaceae bacterium]|jgi:3-oxoacyl-[acyl-carrier protein] reductase|nr:3-oxoacyl-[acyl-carrier-protein] reductase [Holosporaceae bacterium]
MCNIFDLSGKVALVTGATGAIGGAVARMLHRMGATVAVSGTRAENLEILTQELQERTHPFVCDLRSADAVERLVPNVTQTCGNVDILVNNAGITRDDLLMRMGDEAWSDVMFVNLEAPFRLMRAVCRNMIKSRWGRIINISSIVGAVGNPGQTNYAATKSGLFGLSKSAAMELASRNITVNCVAPGFIESPMVKQISEQQRERLEKSIPLGRVGSPAEVAHAVAFLASAEASYITGHILHVNGGMVML